MLKALPWTLALWFSLNACVHSRDYVSTTEALTENGQKVSLASREAVKACKISKTFVGKAKARDIESAVAAAIRNAQNKAGRDQSVGALLYEKTSAFRRWRTHYIAIQFRGYDCLGVKMGNGMPHTSAHAHASAEAQAKVQEQTASQAAAQAASAAASAAAAQASAQAAAQAAMQQQMQPPPPPPPPMF